MSKKFSEQALEIAKQHPDWTLVHPEEYCPIMRELQQQKLTTQQISDELNRRKLLRGNYGGGSHEWNSNIVSMCYRSFTKTALQSGQPAALGGTHNGHCTPATKAFLRTHPDYVAWPDRKLVKWLEEQQEKEYYAYECAELLNEMKIVPAFLRSDSQPEFTASNVAQFYRRCTGKSFSGRSPRSDRKKDPTPKRRRKKTLPRPEEVEKQLKSEVEQEKPKVQEAKTQDLVASSAYVVSVEGMQWLSPTKLQVRVVYEGELSDQAAVTALNRILALAKQEGFQVLTTY